MHKINGRLVNVVEEITKNENKAPYKVLQILTPPEGLIHQIDGEIITVNLGTMDGQKCQAIRLLSNGDKYTNTEKIVDYDLTRVWKLGKSIVFGRPVIRMKNDRPVLLFELCNNQDKPENIIEGDVFLCPVNDYENRNWKIGNVSVLVRNKPYVSRAGGRGVNYTATENQG